MGAIARNIANNITTSGVFTPDALDSGSVTGITALANASDGIDATYKAYKFVFVNIHPATDNAYFTFQANAVIVV
jgi:hypothetical protein